MPATATRGRVDSVRPVTREQRLRAAVGSSVDRLVVASGGDDEQVMFHAVGECTTWLCALEELFWHRPGYESARAADAQGRVLPGVRRARDAVVHGDPVAGIADVADETVVPTPRIVVQSGGSRSSQVIGPSGRAAWTFKPSLPLPAKNNKYFQNQEHAYKTYLAGVEVIVPIRNAVDWLDRVIAGQV
jgi:hypothetical protein